MFEVVYILCLRQLKHYWRSKARLIGSLGQPLLFLIAFGFGFGPMYSRATGGANYINFLAPGIVTMGILFTAIFSGLEVIWDRQFGFLKETMVAPISRTEIMIGKTLGGATIAIIQGLIVLVLTYVVGFRIPSLGSLVLGSAIPVLINTVFIYPYFSGFRLLLKLA
jgi:ABC-2 type transport system permease protein